MTIDKYNVNLMS